MVEAVAKKNKKASKRYRQMSDPSGFMFGDKVQARNPLLPKDDDEEKNHERGNKNRIKSDKKIELDEKIEVEEVAPKVFRYLRHLDGFDEKNLKESLNPENNIDSIFKAGESQGKSGSFFFFS